MLWQPDQLSQRKGEVTKESSARPAFPHQVHGPGQGTGAGESPGVHAFQMP